ncbi:hypothetical protein [Novosphingobium rosa]|uniref:hypothetical protein n=1 Tax=Novosphingobium rosa TaxID=76978 RepID=UPI000835526D|nr:hypothetical protein [Novosphingobium rosa]
MFGFLKRLFSGWGKSAETPEEYTPEPFAPSPVAPEPVAVKPVAVEPVTIEPVIVTPVEAQPVIPAPMAPEPVVIAQPSPNPAAPEPAAPEPYLPEPVAPPPTMLLGDEPLLPGDTESFGMVQSVGNPDAYMIGLIGEQDHAAAVQGLRPGLPVSLELEADNPHDNAAIAAVDLHGRVIGYVGHDSWLREAIYGSGVGFKARVLAVEMGSRGFREVVLEVEPSEEPLRERRYQPPRT